MPNKPLKNIMFAAIVLVTACNSSAQKETETTGTTTASLPYSKGDLIKIKWIEGKWKGMAGGKPFYEIYELIGDTSLKITSFDWNGSDSSNTDVDFVKWIDSAYYLGKNQNYKVTEITGAEITMIPLKAANDIHWIFKDSLSWDVVLKGQKTTANYHMERFDPFKK